ncbi:MAG TPA: hypothetical protein VHB98_15815 [Chloroflexota bacterium]|jgi:hypothetical protein|nr:hypothetical protein [Chloroflexota bacterium]
MARRRTALSGRHRAPLAILASFLLVVLVLAAALVLTSCGASRPTTPTGQATVVVLRTEVAGLQQQATARQTEIAQQQQRIAQQQQRIAQLQRLVGATQTPTYQANGPHSYIVLFQVDRYSCILYLEWVESNGIIRNGRLLTADNYARKASQSFHFTGVDNNGRFSFTGSGQGLTLTFTGTRNSNGTFTVTGMPWYVFYGFTGGTFSQTLHPATLAQYNAAVASLSS